MQSSRGLGGGGFCAAAPDACSSRTGRRPGALLQLRRQHSRQFRANCRGKSAKLRKPDPRQNLLQPPRRADRFCIRLKFGFEGKERERDLGGGGPFLRFFSGFSDTVTFVKEATQLISRHVLWYFSKLVTHL